MIDNIVKWTNKDVNCSIKDVHELGVTGGYAPHFKI